MDDSSEKKLHLDLRILIVGIALLLLFFAAGARFGNYLFHREVLPQTEPAVCVVEVKGCVEQPGLYTMPVGSRVADLLEQAVPAADAKPELLNQAALLRDGSELVIPSGTGDIWDQLAYARNGSYMGVGDAAAEAGGARININTAGVEELQQLNGIGPGKAQAIVDNRQAHGDFLAPEQIMNVKGIGNATYEEIREQICVE